MDKLVLEYKTARTSGNNKKKPPLIMKVSGGQGEKGKEAHSDPTRRTIYHRGVARFNPAPPIFLEDLVEVVAEKYDG